jgi:predicted secreted hydrolase
VNGRSFSAFERLARGAAGLAGAVSDPYRVWLEDWEVGEVGNGSYRLRASAGALTIDLSLKDLKGPVLQGDQGYSQKGPQPGNASFYYSQTRLESEGLILVDGVEYEVAGLSWKDHEYSTSVLSPEQVGWDWFSMQLEDGSELMAYQIRRADGQLDPYSSGTVIRPDGSTRTLQAGDFSIQVEDTWVSPHSGARYPSRWVVSVPSESLRLEIMPVIEDQELNLTFIYWEGAVDIIGARAGIPISGSGYVEMTGYAGAFAGEF